MTDGGPPDEGAPAGDLLDQAPFAYLSTTSDGLVVRANGTLLRWTGRERGQVEGHPVSELLTPGGQLFYETHVSALLHAQGRVEGIALDLRGPDGGAVPVLASAEQPAGHGGLVHVSLVSTRSRAAYESELRRSRAQAEQSAARLHLLHEVREACRSALDASDVVAALVRSLTTATRGGAVTVWLHDAEGRLLLQAGEPGAASPAVLSPAAPLPAAEAARRSTPLVLSQELLERDWPDAAQALADRGREALLVAPLVGEGSVLGVVQVALRRDRALPPGELDVLDAIGHEAGQALLRCELPAHLQGMPLRDAVTGTATPALFGERVAAALARAADRRLSLTVLLLDVTLSRPALPSTGDPPPSSDDDAVLADLGRRLRQAAGDDSVARVGRQRFAVLSEGCGTTAARTYADRLQAALSGATGEQSATVTVGAAVLEAHSDRAVSVATLLDWAGDALDQARARGPGRRVVSGPASRQAARSLVDGEKAVRLALASDDVLLHYQPVVNLRTGRVVMAEALCRLRAQDGALLQPSQFIDAAEDSGLVVPLGRRVLALACEQQRVWAGQGRVLDVSVNVAAAQADEPGFAGEVLDLLDRTGCPPERLVLELTESALLAATPSTLRSFAVLRRTGVRVALDDFGTRYASLDYVRSFPLDELKIDQSFVSGLPHSRVSRAIVRMVAQLAAELDLACVAEGIETVEQARFLRDLELLGQGYALGEPVVADDLMGWVTPTAWLAPSPRAASDAGPTSPRRA